MSHPCLSSPLRAAALSLAALACAGAEPADPVPGAPAAAARPTRAEPDARARLGDGFVVWESNRSGSFRLWTRRLDGSGLRQLTPEDGERVHCCPHLSPDGERLAWVRIAAGQEAYPAATDAELHVLRLADGSDRVIADGTRTYYENRAVIWVDDHVLHHIDGDGHSVRLDIDSGEREVLTAEPRRERGWLLDASGRWATHGDPTFSRYRHEQRTVLEARSFGGCQPYFSHDGTWGFWTAGAGGPLNRIDLATRQVGTILRKNDPRLPDDRGYMYFPMLSRAGDLLAFAASDNQHDHFTSDYDVFVAETDPATLEMMGPPVRITTDPATDRYPDVFRPRLPLGRHLGEAPFAVTFDPGDGGDWRWEVEGRVTSAAPRLAHRFDAPGVYTIRASRAGEQLVGRVIVRSARPPELTSLRFRGELEVVLGFDEAIDLSAARFTIDGTELGARNDGDRGVILSLPASLEAPADLLIAGVSDRATVGNVMAPTTRRLSPPIAWPSDRTDLVFLFETADRDNAAVAPGGGERTFTLQRSGLATLDHDHALVTTGGHWAAPWEAAQMVARTIKRSNELTLEATVTPAALDVGHRARIVTSSSGPRSRNFSLVQYGDRLSLWLRTATTEHNGREFRLGHFRERRPHHVVVSYAPGRLIAFLDGRQVLNSGTLQGDFFHWNDRALLFGDEWQGDHAWQGTIEGVAIYARALAAEEATENHRRYRALAARRPAVAARTVEATALACSRPPTLDEIAPYRRALTLCEWRTGEGERLRVAHWSLLDGRPVALPTAGATRALRLEPYASNPQIHADVLGDSLTEDLDAPLHYAIGGLTWAQAR